MCCNTVLEEYFNAVPRPTVQLKQRSHQPSLTYVSLVPGKLSGDTKTHPPLVERRPALFSSHLRCHQRATHISWEAAVSSSVGRHLGAWNCLWQLTGDLLYYIWHLASRIHISCLVASCVLCGSMARLWLCLNTQRMLEPCRLLMFLIGKMISCMVIILSLKFKMIPNYFMVSVPRMRSYCGLLSLSYSTTSGSIWFLIISEYL